MESSKKKTAIITGASRGIGSGIAMVLAKAGYNLILTCEKNSNKLALLSEELMTLYGTTIYTMTGDVSTEEFVKRLTNAIESNHIDIDVLINNAGTWKGGQINDISLADWNRLLSVNLTGPFLMCRAISPLMVKNKRGCIINISSIWGVKGASCESAYSATKGGLNAFTQALAMELAPSNITVNAIAPGVIDTDMNNGYSEEERQALLDEIPMARFGEPEDIGKAVLSLINTPYITGQIITVDGGFL